MRTAFKPFLLGIVITSVTWIVILYFYFVLNPLPAGLVHPSTAHQIVQKLSRSKTFSHTSSEEHGRVKETVTKNSGLAEDFSDDLGLVRTKEDQRVREDGYRHHAFNVLVSSRLDYHREIPDTRHKMCKTQEYQENLPNASIIVCFYNEDKHTLYRTVYSVLDRTPQNLLHEILLIDDYSDDGVHDEIDAYIKKNFPSKVRMLKTKRREGLIRARIFGAKQSTGQVFVFLDSHCEVNQQWLEPLLDRVRINRTFVVTPIIDIINSDTFQYTSSPLVRGGFNWGLHFKWDSLPDQFLKKPEDFVKPIQSPTMAGGLFAIEREYFFDIGEYDAGMNVWGGENLEISFRLWMCGGRLEIIPCSRVGHVFRRRRPYGSPDGEDTMTYNSLRAAHVWLDDYIEYYYKIRPDARRISYGDVGPRQRLRRLMNCQSFEWYLKNVYPELQIPGKEDKSAQKVDKSANRTWNFPRRRFHNKNYIGTYQIRVSGTSLCVQSLREVTDKGSSLILTKCARTKKQLWSETDKGELLLAEMLCLESPESSQHKPHLAKCHEMGGLQEWKHTDDVDTPLYNTAAGLCLGIADASENQLPDSIEENTPIVMTLCAESVATKWDLIAYKL